MADDNALPRPILREYAVQARIGRTIPLDVVAAVFEDVVDCIDACDESEECRGDTLPDVAATIRSLESERDTAVDARIETEKELEELREAHVKELADERAERHLLESASRSRVEELEAEIERLKDQATRSFEWQQRHEDEARIAAERDLAAARAENERLWKLLEGAAKIPADAALMTIRIAVGGRLIDKTGTRAQETYAVPTRSEKRRARAAR